MKVLSYNFASSPAVIIVTNTPSQVYHGTIDMQGPYSIHICKTAELHAGKHVLLRHVHAKGANP